jgi:hypothetical protein
MVRLTVGSAAVAVAITLLLSSCSSTDPVAQQPNESTSAQPTCTITEIDQGSAWIKGQLDAFSEEDPETAYSFASESFKAGSSVQQFIAIIVSNYGFLLSTRSYTIGDCTKQGELFLFDVQVTDTAGQKYPMEYTLSKIANTWGVDAASVTVGEDEPVYS